MIAAGSKGTADSRAALDELLRMYWHPLYAFVRRAGHDDASAADIVQSFLARLIESGSLGAVDPQRGRFRSWLRVALRNFMSNEREKAAADKRGGGVAPIELDLAQTERVENGLRDDETPESAFDRTWALAVIESAMERTGREYEADGRGALFTALEPVLDGSSGRPYAEIATELGLSEAAVKVAVHRLRRRFRDSLRATVAETLDTESELDDEVRALFAALGGSSRQIR